MNSRNESFIFEPNCHIVEYDIKSCNTSICREYKLLPDKVLDSIDKMPSYERKVKFGLIRQKNKELSREHTKRVDEVVKQFISQNNLKFEDDIVSIKNDAVFTFNRDIPFPTVGEHVVFRPKNHYHAYLYMRPFEFYFRSDKNEYDAMVDVKNLTSDIEVLKRHSNGILALLSEFVEVVEKSNSDYKEIHEFCSTIVKAYKKRELVPDIYREFNPNSKYNSHYKIKSSTIMDRYQDSSFDIYLKDAPLDEDGYITDDVDILYNYMNIILPLIKMVVG